MISLADSQVLRWIDEINGVYDAERRAREIKRRIRDIHKAENCAEHKRLLRALYAELDKVQFKPDYMCLIIDKDKDYYRANKGFMINGVKYERLLGTAGGIKNRTIVYVSKAVAPEIKRRIDNGRDMTKELVPAKLEAYKALACSATIPVSMPAGVLVVPDCETQFYSDIIYLSNEDSDEPIMEEREHELIELTESDGYGLMLPSLAKRWSAELRLSYTMSGCATRCAYEKGMVFPFDFIDFAEKVGGTFMVKDAWGNEVDIRTVELILTTSMLKLWDSYKSCDDYLQNCVENGYTFGITKTCPAQLEKERGTNYQFIQPYSLSDADIDKLISPTMSEIEDVLGGDYAKTVLFLKGCGLKDDDISSLANNYAKAIMIDPRILNDPYIQNNIYQLIKNRINEAKVGVLNVRGNYSIICGDPFSLCQSIFGLPVTGLLKAGEIYNKFWLDAGADKLTCFRAPMSVANNIRLVHVHNSEAASYWYKYMTTCTLMNSFDTTVHALNGADKDGDLVMLTDDETLVNCFTPLPAIMCAQRRAAKKIVTESDIIQSNVNSFGDEIGKITNRVTSMYEVRARYDEDSPEYRELDYRIKCGQLLQQDSIDKAKGIISKPMPKAWYDWKSAVNMPVDKRDLYTAIVADKKPYFMRYIYPALMKDYNTYIKKSSRACLREFGKTIEELLSTPSGELTNKQMAFLRQYRNKMPVGVSNCVMNKICRKFEVAFDSVQARRLKLGEFDYEIMKSGAEYSKAEFNKLSKLYDTYITEVKNIAALSSSSRLTPDEIKKRYDALHARFSRECEMICPNSKTLCDIIIDLCYGEKRNKKFAWDICGEQIIENLLNRNGRTLSYPTEDANGDIYFRGLTFTLKQTTLEGESNEYNS